MPIHRSWEAPWCPMEELEVAVIHCVSCVAVNAFRRSRYSVPGLAKVGVDEVERLLRNARLDNHVGRTYHSLALA